MRITPLVLAVALFMEMMDSTVISTSLPAIAADIGTQPVALKLALTTYLVALAIFIPISGWIADRFGARNVFRWAIMVFMVGSIACAFSDSLTTFVLSRFLQGMGGSMMSPIARLILVRSTPREDMVNAWAWLTMPALIGPLAGPPLGGFLTTYLSWHWIFWVNVPIGLTGIVLASRFLPVKNYRDRRQFDFSGFVLIGLAFSGVIFGLSVLSMPALPLWVGLSTSVAGLAFGGLYVAHARRVTDPVVNIALFREPIYRATIISGTLLRFGIGAVPFLLPLMLQLGFGYTPFQSGAITFTGAFGAIIVKFAASRIYARFGFRRTLVLAAPVSSLFVGMQALFVETTPVAVIMIVLLLAGFFRSMFFTGLNALTFSEIGEAEAAQATAISSVMQQFSMAFGIALAAGILEISTLVHGGTLSVADFHAAFILVALICATAAIPILRLSPDAGAAVSGHKGKDVAAPAPGQ